MAHNPTNTIDFDAARLQRLSEPSPTQHQPLTLPELRQQLSQALQSSLELERILNLYLQNLQRLIPMSGLSYQHDYLNASIKLGQRARHSSQYQLSHNGEGLGQITFERDQRFSEQELTQLEVLLASLLFPLRNALLYRSAVQRALSDPLTGAGNRIAMDQALEREVELSRRSQQPLSLLMLDIDFFKRINDTYGHTVGDQAIKAVANTLKANLRNIDMLFRYGGEEFLVLLNNTSSEAAVQVGERLRQAVQDWRYQEQDITFSLSISLGCATLRPGENAASLQQRADEALYRAKHQGRNRLQLAC